MSEDKLNASGFEFYEGIRIAIPGALLLALFVGVNSTFRLGAPKPDALIGVIVALGLGLFLYFVDISGRSQIYAAALPHRVLEGWGLQPPAGMSLHNTYFVVLDSLMPAGIRNRALYFGSIFRIGFEAIYLAAIPAVAVLTVAIVTSSPDALRTTDTTVLWLAVPCHALAAVLGLSEGYSITRRRHKNAGGATAEMVRRSGQQVGRLGIAALTVAALALLAYLLVCDHAAFISLAVGLPLFVWATRYLVGYPQHGSGQRRNIDVATGSVLLALPVLLATVLAATQLPAQSVLGTGAALGWSAAALIAEVLLARRGHERKLWAAFHTQKAWFELNREAVVKAAKLKPPQP